MIHAQPVRAAAVIAGLRRRHLDPLVIVERPHSHRAVDQPAPKLGADHVTHPRVFPRASFEGRMRARQVRVAEGDLLADGRWRSWHGSPRPDWRSHCVPVNMPWRRAHGKSLRRTIIGDAVADCRMFAGSGAWTNARSVKLRDTGLTAPTAPSQTRFARCWLHRPWMRRGNVCRRHRCGEVTGEPHFGAAIVTVRVMCNSSPSACLVRGVLLPLVTGRLMRNALGDRGPVVSLKRRSGFKPLRRRSS